MGKTRDKRPAQPAETTAPVDPVWIALAVFYAVSLALLKPWWLNFPLNDDWAYALSVRHLVQEGRWRITDWSAVTQVAQTLWGAVWVRCLGWSLGTLKLSTLAAAAVGALSFNSILKSAKVSASSRLPAVLLLAANPLYYCLSFSFMTDVPYLALALLACQFYLWAEAESGEQGAVETGAVRRELLWTALGSAFAAGAYLVRQTGLLLPAGYCLCLFMRKKPSPTKLLLLWALPAAAAVAYGAWFRFVHGPTWASANVLWSAMFQYLLSSSSIGGISRRLIASLLLMGFFALPMAAGLAASPGQLGKDKHFGAAAPWLPALAVAYLIAASIYMISRGWMPQMGNMLNRSGLGPTTLAHASAKASGFWGWDGFWIAVSLGSLISTWVTALASIGCQVAPPPLEAAAVRIVGIPALLQFFVFVARDRFFDRYVLLLLPAALLAAALCAGRWRFSRSAAWAGTLGMIALAFLGTQDYLAWNEAKWELATEGASHGLAPEEIAAGFDWEGYWTYEKNMAVLKASKPLNRIGDWDWQGLNRYKAVISFDAGIPDLRVAAWKPYRTYLSRRRQVIYLLAQN